MTGDNSVRGFLTTWLAITAIAICPFFCMGEACGDVSGKDATPRSACCPHCCHGDAPAENGNGDQDDCCPTDCLCKGALPVKPPVAPTPPALSDVLPADPHVVGVDGEFHLTSPNRHGSPQSSIDCGFGLRIALCSFLS